MLKLVPVVYILAATVLAGTFVIAALSLNRIDATAVSVSALAGALLAIPVAWIVSDRILKQIRRS